VGLPNRDWFITDLDIGPLPRNAAKLELPSISQVHSRGPVESWFGSQQTPRPAVSGERLPALTQLQSHGPSSASSSPRGGSYSSSVYNGSVSSATSYSASVNGQASSFKTPSPETSPSSFARENGSLHDQNSPYGQQGVTGLEFGVDYHNSMNHIGTYNPADVHQSHMATTHAHPPTSGPTALGGHYSAYQAPMMQHGAGAYPSSASYAYPYPAYSAAPVTSSMSSNLVVAQPAPLSSE
jgi:enhanced filamentous growth protein 1